MTSKCKLCGGNAGRLGPDGIHFLCAARAAQGLPTPSLGTRCPTCDGAGTLGRGGAMLFTALGPAAIERSIRAQFPPCHSCRGKGSV